MAKFRKLALLCAAILASGTMALATTGCDLLPTDWFSSISNSSTSETPEVITYEVKFVNYDGTVLQTVEVEEGATPEYTGETPTKAATAQHSYTFAGWDATIVAATANVTYTATFTETVNNYTVSFNTDGGSAVEAQTVPYGTTASGLNALTSTKEGYKFVGWTLANGDAIPENATVTEDITLKAKWELVTYSAKIIRADGTEETVNFTIENRAEKLAAIALTEDDEQYTYAWATDLPTVLALNDEQVFTETKAVRKYTYTVKHYLAMDDQSENTDLSGYRLYKVETLEDIAGAATTATAITLTGFEAEEITQSTVATDASTVVNVFYARDMLVQTFEQFAAASEPYVDEVVAPWSWAGNTLSYDGTNIVGLAPAGENPHIVTANSSSASWMNTTVTPSEAPYEGENSMRLGWNSIGVNIVIYLNDAQKAMYAKGGTLTFAIKWTGADSVGYTLSISGGKDWTSSDMDQFHKYDYDVDGCDIWQNQHAKGWSVITVGEDSRQSIIENGYFTLNGWTTNEARNSAGCIWIDNVAVSFVTGYKVNHYVANSADATPGVLDGYTLYTSEQKGGDAGATTNAAALDIAGYKLQAEIVQDVIAEDESTVINVYYSISKLTETFENYTSEGWTESTAVEGWEGWTSLLYNGVDTGIRSSAMAGMEVTDSSKQSVVTINDIGGTADNSASSGVMSVRFYNRNNALGKMVITLSDEQIAVLKDGGTLSFAIKLTNAYSTHAQGSFGAWMSINNSHDYTITVDGNSKSGEFYDYDHTVDGCDIWQSYTTQSWALLTIDGDLNQQIAEDGYIIIETEGISATRTGGYYCWIDDIKVTPKAE